MGIFHSMPSATYIAASLCAVLLSACVNTSVDMSKDVQRGQLIYTAECAQCHGARGQGGGSAAAGLGVAPPDLAGLKQRNDGYFPREFVSRFVMGQLEKDDPNSPMPDFSATGLRHVYPNGGADGEVLESDFLDLLTYLEAIQE
jgi:mono/diheme cytochrome c family protein